MNYNYKVFRYYIDLAICDISFLKFKESNYQTYYSYSSYIKTMLSNISEYEYEIKIILADFLDELNEIFNLDENEGINYIIEFFIDEKYLKFYETIYNVRDIFGHFMVD
jgi:hypothetical protein